MVSFPLKFTAQPVTSGKHSKDPKKERFVKSVVPTKISGPIVHHTILKQLVVNVYKRLIRNPKGSDVNGQ